MLVGAFAAVAGSHFGGSLQAGVLSAVAAAVVFSSLLAVGSALLRGNDIVIGISLNLLAAGLTSFLLRTLFGVSGTFSDSAMLVCRASAFRVWHHCRCSARRSGIRISWSIFLGSWVAAITVFLNRTPWGLRLRGIGGSLRRRSRLVPMPPATASW